MARFKYRCATCGNEIESTKAEVRKPGSKHPVRLIPSVECESCDVEMDLVSYDPPAPGVSPR